ncbi:GGDEF domain-containing protein [uncultured Maricaulis sp.]|uniref:GGDEF domain-containing protein n=1 Tax=uncultured Maricaulis sp. TaxID=174710 RepID=UPI0030D7E2E3
MRQTDHVARLGGEEFVALIHAGSGASAAEIAERVRGAVEAQPFRSDGLEISVTISAGLVELAEAQPSLTRLLKLADEALYRAKGAGRNRIILAAA